MTDVPEPTFKLINPDKPAQVAIKCRKCGFISYNKYDVLYKYCGKCHIFHEEQLLKEYWDELN